MPEKICNSIHNMAFVMTGCVDRDAVMYGFSGFVFGVALGIACCSML